MIDEDMYSKINQRLSEGQIVKNYKELCKILDLPVCGGNQKVLQMKDLERFCEMEKRGHQIQITKIFENPYIKIDGRMEGNRKLWIPDIEMLLLQYFINKKKAKSGSTFYFTKRKLSEIFALVNEDYAKYINDTHLLEMDIREKLLTNQTISQWEINNFYARIQRISNGIITRVLKSLKNRKLIDYNNNIIMAKRSGRKGRYIKVRHEWQIEKILEIERETIDDLVGATTIDKEGKEIPTTMKDIVFNSRGVTYAKYCMVRNERLKEKLGFDFIYRVYEITCNSKYLERGLAENIQMIEDRINTRMIDTANKDAKKAVEKTEKIKDRRFRYPRSYLQIQNILAMELLNIDKKQIEEFEQMERLNQYLFEDGEKENISDISLFTYIDSEIPDIPEEYKLTL